MFSKAEIEAAKNSLKDQFQNSDLLIYSEVGSQEEDKEFEVLVTNILKAVEETRTGKRHMINLYGEMTPRASMNVIPKVERSPEEEAGLKFYTEKAIEEGVK
jgi:hypothetical protein